MSGPTKEQPKLGLKDKFHAALAACNAAYRSVHLPPEDIGRWKITKRKSKDEEKSLPRFVPHDVMLFVGLVGDDKQTRMQNDLQQLINGLKDIANKDPKDPNAQVMKEALFNLLYMSGFQKTQGHSTSVDAQHGSYLLARRVKQNTGRSGQLPDCRAVFDQLLTHGATKKTNQDISGFAHALGTILSLSLFRVPQSEEDASKLNGTSPRLDLSPLYGVGSTCPIIDPKAESMLLPDCFAEDRVEHLTPAVSVLLILFNRHHNYIARRLVAIKNHEWDPAKRDQQIFECAKTINCILFKDIILRDFLKGVLGFPFVETEKLSSEDLEKAGDKSTNDVYRLKKSKFPDVRFLTATAGDKDRIKDNTLSMSFVESAQLYDFTGLMSLDDEIWQAQLLEQVGVGATSTDGDIALVIKSLQEQRANERETFPCPTVSSTGNTADKTIPRSTEEGNRDYFEDGHLAQILVDTTKTPSGLPGPRSLSLMSRYFITSQIKRARGHCVCTLNEFRTYLGLQPYSDFTEWCDNKEVCDDAKKLYTTIDNMELYPGLLAEKSIGQGFRLGFTQAYGLFKDIVKITVICNDPRFTTDFNAENLTQWGHKFSQSFCRGSEDVLAMQALLLRTLPRCFPYNHITVHLPLARIDATLSAQIQHIQHWPYSDIDIASIPAIEIVNTWDDIRQVMNNEEFVTPYGKAMKALTGGYGHMLGFNGQTLHTADRRMVLFSLMPDSRTFGGYRHFFNQAAKEFIKNHGRRDASGNVITVDLVRDVINPLCIQWVLGTLCGEKAVSLTPEVLGHYMQDVSLLFAYVFKRFERADEWDGRQNAMDMSNKIGDVIKQRLSMKLHDQSSAQKMASSLLEEMWDDICHFRFFRGFVARYIFRIIEELTTGQTLDRLSFTFMERLIKTDHIPGVGRLPEKTKPGSKGDLLDPGNELEEIAELCDRISYAVQDLNSNGPDQSGASKDNMLSGLLRKALETFGISWSEATSREERSERIFAEALKRFRLARLSANVVGLCVMMSVNYASVCSIVVDFYLQERNSDHKKDIIALVNMQKPGEGGLRDWIDKIEAMPTQPFGPFPTKTELHPPGEQPTQTEDTQNKSPEIPRKLQDFLLMNYIREAQRLEASPILERIRRKDQDVDPSQVEKIFADFQALHSNANLFPDPEKVDPTRSIYLYHGTGPCMRSPGQSITIDAKACPQHRDLDQIKRCKEQTDQCPCPHSGGCEPLPDPEPAIQSTSPTGQASNQGCMLHVGLGCASSLAFERPCSLHAEGKSCKVHGFRPWSIQGLGMHKCPGLSFCDNTMPELLKAVFSLQNIRLQESNGIEGSKFRPYKHRLEQPSAKHSADPNDLTLYIDGKGDIYPYPITMTVQFDESPDNQLEESETWMYPTPPYPKSAEKLVIISCAITFVLYYLWVPCLLIRTSDIMPWFAIFSRVQPPSRLVPLAKPCCGQEDSATILKNSTCNPPITVYRYWDVNTFFPGHDGHPSPVEYTLERSNPHRLSLIDIDKRDMQLGVFVDGVFMGHTSEFQLDPWVNCSPDSPDGVEGCVSKGFSKGSFVVPAGKHTVRIVWAGKEHLPGKTSLDWGQERARRFMWRLENCG